MNTEQIMSSAIFAPVMVFGNILMKNCQSASSLNSRFFFSRYLHNRQVSRFQIDEFLAIHFIPPIDQRKSNKLEKDFHFITSTIPNAHGLTYWIYLVKNIRTETDDRRENFSTVAVFPMHQETTSNIPGRSTANSSDGSFHPSTVNGPIHPDTSHPFCSHPFHRNN